MAARPACAGTPAPDPLLHDAPQSACQSGADYVAGVDAEGEPVVPADLGAPKVPLPQQLVVPLKGHGRGQDGAYAVLDGHQIAPLVDPKTCR